MKPRLAPLLARIRSLDVDGAEDFIFTRLREPGFSRIATINAEYLMLARDSASFLAAIEPADVWLPDGSGIRWAAAFTARATGRNFLARVFWFVLLGAAMIFLPRLTRDPIRGEVSGAELVPRLLARAEREGAPVLAIGRGDGLSSEDEIRSVILGRFPKLELRTDFRMRAGFVPADLTSSVAAHRGIVLVATGMETQEQLLDAAARWQISDVKGQMRSDDPAQESDIWHVKSEICGVAALGVGSSLDRLTGRQKQDPAWARRTGLLWLVRAARELISPRSSAEKAHRLGRVGRAFPGFAVWAFREAGTRN